MADKYNPPEPNWANLVDTIIEKGFSFVEAVGIVNTMKEDAEFGVKSWHIDNNGHVYPDFDVPDAI